METIHIGSDHAGFELKSKLIDYLNHFGYNIQDHGTFSNESVDYPDYAHVVAKEVGNGNGIGVLICGSANGVAITANKHKGVRAALCWIDEIAQLARAHNDANILCLPARFISFVEAQTICKTFFDTPFEGGRHQNRVGKIDC